jgi:hypothetical protein
VNPERVTKIYSDLVKDIRKESREKTVTDWQYINLTNFVSFTDPEIENKRLRALCKKFNIPFALFLPRSKYKEAMKYLRSGEWNKE